MIDLSPEERRRRWEAKKIILQSLIDEHQHKIYNPNIKGSVTTLIPKHKSKEETEISKTFIFPLTFDSSKEARLMLSWMDSYTEMYNVAMRHIREEIKQLAIVPHEIDKDKLKKKDNLLSFYNLRNKLLEEKEKIRLYSNVRFYEKDFHYRTKSSKNLIYSHTLDMAVRKCCSDCKSMLTNFIRGHIPSYSFNELDYERRNRIIEFEKTCFNNEGKIPYFLSIKYLYNGEVYDSVFPSHEVIIDYDKVSDKFRLLMPKTQLVEKKQKPNKIVSIDLGIRNPLSFVSDNSFGTIEDGDKVKNKICDKFNKLDRILKHPEIKNNKIKKKHKRRTKYQVKNLVEGYQWKVSSFLSETYDTVIIGDINTKSIISNTKNMGKFNKRLITALSHRKLIDRIRYKCQEKNSQFILVDESYTSKCCSQCGWYNEKLGDSEVFICEKGCKLLGRDINAARNIMLKSLDKSSISI